MSLEEFESAVALQNGVCAICRCDLGDKPHVDHDHDTGEVRGLLCFNCNGGLGQFGDDAARLRGALEYLRFHRPTTSQVERRLRRRVPMPRSPKHAYVDLAHPRQAVFVAPHAGDATGQ